MNIKEMVLDYLDRGELNPLKSIKEIVMDGLEYHEFDGLWSIDGECACKRDDLMPCSEPSPRCTAGYLQPCLADCGCRGFHVGDKKAWRAND